MLEWDFGAGAPVWEALDARFVRETIENVGTWLAREPAADALGRNVGALEFALGSSVHNRDAELRMLVTKALEKVQSGANFDELSNETLGAWIGLNLRAAQVTQDARFENGARLMLACANARWDEGNAFFKTNAADTTNVFYTDGNARIGEAFYLAWRELDDQTLRPKAGIVLGQVSDLFDADAGLYCRKEMPDGTAGEPNRLGAYAAAIQMFLTASELTARGTYTARACIVANYALAHADEIQGDWENRFLFGRGLARLAQIYPAEYRDEAVEHLRSVTQGSAFSLAP